MPPWSEKLWLCKIFWVFIGFETMTTRRLTQHSTGPHITWFLIAMVHNIYLKLNQVMCGGKWGPTATYNMTTHQEPRGLQAAGTVNVNRKH